MSQLLVCPTYLNSITIKSSWYKILHKRFLRLTSSTGVEGGGGEGRGGALSASWVIYINVNLHSITVVYCLKCMSPTEQYRRPANTYLHSHMQRVHWETLSLVHLFYYHFKLSGTPSLNHLRISIVLSFSQEPSVASWISTI